MNSKLKTGLYFVIIYGFFCLLSLNRHSKALPFNYHSELFADKAGYNVYLPALFIYSQSNPFPDSLASKTGYGFEIDSVSHHIITKYPYGVALLQSPFWLLAHLVSDDQSGYSIYYQRSIDLSACFYFTLGLFMLFFTLKDYHTYKKAALLVFLIALSTGIFYYGIFDTGMSHIYSFCCLSAILFLFFKKKLSNHFGCFLILSIVSSLFIIIRPVNAIFLIPVLYYFLKLSPNLRFALLRTLKYYQWILLLVMSVTIALPQLYYYKYAFGSFFSNSYHKEPFFLPSITRLAELLFSSNNGLFIYYPVIIISVLFSIFNRNSYTKLITVILLSYILLYASWWSLSLGCGFGHRAFNDIILVLFIPLCFTNKKIPKMIYVFLFILCMINIKFTFSFDGCLYTLQNWNYAEYFSILFGDFK